VTPNQLKRFLAYLDAVARAHDREAETAVKPDRFPVVNLNFGGPRRDRQAFASKQGAAAPAAPTEPLKKPEGVKAAPREAPAAVPATAPLVGLTEAALRLDCHRRTVRAYIRAGLLPGLLLAGRWKIRREDLDAFIEGALRRIEAET
jgi:excisionase family DNA binding protein